jgi:hypothetical protein
MARGQKRPRARCPGCGGRFAANLLAGKAQLWMINKHMRSDGSWCQPENGPAQRRWSVPVGAPGAPDEKQPV